MSYLRLIPRLSAQLCCRSGCGAGHEAQASQGCSCMLGLPFVAQYAPSWAPKRPSWATEPDLLHRLRLAPALAQSLCTGAARPLPANSYALTPCFHPATSSPAGAMHPLSSEVVKACLPDGQRKPFRHNMMALMTVTGAKGSVVNFSQVGAGLADTSLTVFAAANGQRVFRRCSCVMPVMHAAANCPAPTSKQAIDQLPNPTAPPWSCRSPACWASRSSKAAVCPA